MNCRMTISRILFLIGIPFIAHAAAPFDFGLEEGFSIFEFRELVDGKLAEEAFPIPRDAVRMFVYGKQASGVGLTVEHIAVDYGLSGCLFDRETGELVRKFTFADGWPGRGDYDRDDFAPHQVSGPGSGLLGPGIVQPKSKHEGEIFPATAVATTMGFQGKTWRAVQPILFSANPGYARMESYPDWTSILEGLVEGSFVESEAPDTGPRRRYRMEDGLAGNIVTRFAVADGRLWTACADIYNRDNEQWGPGGLCWYDEENDRWIKVQEIDGRSVRWVTLLQTLGDELWVGFREGEGVEGDWVAYGMNIGLGEYRPRTTAIVLARLKAGGWTSYSRPPKEEGKAPTEKPVRLVRFGPKVFLLSHVDIASSGAWRTKQNGYVSLLDPETGEWVTWDPGTEFGTTGVTAILVVDDELFTATDRGLHRYNRETTSWTFLDPEFALPHSSLGPAIALGNELWVGYGIRADEFTWTDDPGEHGIVRFNEGTGRWTRMSSRELETDCMVRDLVASPDGDVYVVFEPFLPSWLRGNAYPYSGRECDPPRAFSMGRYSNGTWEHPLPLDGIPAAREVKLKKPQRVEGMPITNLVSVGDRLLLCTGAGVYEGPAPWREVFSVPAPWDMDITQARPVSIALTEDAKAITIKYKNPETFQTDRKLSKARYTPGQPGLEFSEEPLPEPEPDTYRYRQLDPSGLPLIMPWSKGGLCIHVPVATDGDWYLNPVYSSAVLVETPSALWVKEDGMLIRLDREKLADWFGGPDAGN